MNKADLKFLRKAGFNIAFGVIVGEFVTQVAYRFAIKMMDKKMPESNKTEE